MLKKTLAAVSLIVAATASAQTSYEFTHYTGKKLTGKVYAGNWEQAIRTHYGPVWGQYALEVIYGKIVTVGVWEDAWFKTVQNAGQDWLQSQMDSYGHVPSWCPAEHNCGIAAMTKITLNTYEVEGKTNHTVRVSHDTASMFAQGVYTPNVAYGITWGLAISYVPYMRSIIWDAE